MLHFVGRWLVLGFIVLGFAESPLQANLRPVQEYWAETGLRLPYVAAEVNTQRCSQEAAAFIGCLAALNALAQQMVPPARLLPLAIAEARIDEIDAELGVFGNFRLVRFRSLAETHRSPQIRAAEIYQRYRERLRAEQEAAQAAFAALGKHALSATEALAFLASNLVRPENEALVASIAINAHLEAVADPHTRISPTALDRDRSNQSGSSFVGVGIILAEENGAIVVRNPIEGGPAHLSGIRARDVITQVDSRPLEGMSVSQAVRLIVGEPGTQVTLHILRDRRPLTLTVTRASINTPNVRVSTQTLRGKKIGTLSLTTFASYSACVDVKNGLTELTRQGAEALIFDLRGNGGGFVDQAVCIASLFLGSGKSVFEQRNLLSEDRRTFSTTGQAQTSLPMITLIDGGSASASEILAGAFQDHARSLIAGRRSFGKATMQLGMEHRLPGITLWMTVARFYLPSGRTNQLVGITPDFELEPKPDATLDDLFELREEDLYTNALPALSEPWQQTRPQVIRMIRNSCAGHERRIRRAYQAASQGPFAPDYPLIAAADLLRCTTETALVR